VVVAAGIARGGTVAAGEFLVDPNRMQEMLKQVPSNWKQKNIEIVLETQIIQDRSGPPRIAAVYVW
jgi:Cft2 family RNA processing exonuclease